MDEPLKLSPYFEKVFPYWPKFYKQNNYYHKDLQKLTRSLIPKDTSVLEFGCKQGELLASLGNRHKMGIELNKEIIERARRKYPSIEFKYCEYDQFPTKQKFDYIILTNIIHYLSDVQQFVKKLHNISHEDTRIIVIYFSFFWKPFLDIAEKLKLRLPQPFEPNWLDHEDIFNIFTLEKFDEVKTGRRFLSPYNLFFISDFINKYLAYLPIINRFCLINYAVFRPKPKTRNYSVSIIIPARNEEGNIPNILKKIPVLGKKTEVIFVEGNSKDKTYEAIKKEVANYKGPIKPSFCKQKGRGKKDAVFLGFSKAKNEILMILDADLTVSPSELSKFYDALSNGIAEFANGSRLVYPLRKQAMRFLNYLANKFFSVAFTFLLGQRIKDTLCGTKVLFKKDFLKIKKNSSYFGEFDFFGDFDLLFGAFKLNLKIVEIPVRYKERTYGTTNISRFQHGFLLLKMVLFAAKKLKFV